MTKHFFKHCKQYKVYKQNEVCSWHNGRQSFILYTLLKHLSTVLRHLYYYEWENSFWGGLQPLIFSLLPLSRILSTSVAKFKASLQFSKSLHRAEQELGKGREFIKLILPQKGLLAFIATQEQKQYKWTKSCS